MTIGDDGLHAISTRLGNIEMAVQTLADAVAYNAKLLAKIDEHLAPQEGDDGLQGSIDELMAAMRALSKELELETAARSVKGVNAQPVSRPGTQTTRKSAREPDGEHLTGTLTIPKAQLS